MLAFSAAEAALSFLFLCAIKLTIVLACAGLLVFLLRSGSSALRHHIWAAAIGGCLLLPAFVVTLPAWNSHTLGRAAAALTPAHSGEPSGVTQTTIRVTANASATPFLSNQIATSMLILWILGMCVALLRILTGLIWLAWFSARSKPFFEDEWMREVLNVSASFGIARPVRLRESASPVAMPLTCGVLSPVIILPRGAAEWSEERRRIVLRHELAHVARHDWLLQMCAEVARALYWVHPLVWLAAAQLRQESERASDDVVLLSGVAPANYARQLLDLARTLQTPGRAWATALAIARPSNLERRFAAMLNSSVHRNQLSASVKFLIPCLALMLLLPLAALHVSAQNLSGKVAGIITDPSGTGVANATIIMHNHEAKTIDMTTSDRDGNYLFKGLPSGNYEVQVVKPGFEVYHVNEVSLDPGRDFIANFALRVGVITEQVTVVTGSEKPLVTEKTNGKPSRVAVGGTIQAAKLVNKVMPIYPDSAKSAGIQGVVILHAVIGMDGRPESLHVVNSQIDPELAKSAVEAVSQWRYTPTLLNGEPIEVDTTIQVNYTLQP